ncbi:MAG: bifunctional 4-hydroxy-2-oxoglutarate aldolase/2-dehydro-3-deoxy-phosphogluconate aldolase [Candidatus Omnitrophota bacterium]
MDINKFLKLPIMGILRGAKPDIIEPLIEALIGAGLETLEITLNTQGAPGLIAKAKRLAGNKLTLGAGTVLDMDSLKSALDSGATFIVSPVLIEDVTRCCVKNKIPVFPGALTPEEIYRAWQAGAAMVKVFPAKFFGPEYFKEIRGPFNDIRLLACSGVTPQNMNDYFQAGVSAVTFGSSVFRPDWLEKRDFAGIAGVVAKYIRGYKK